METDKKFYFIIYQSGCEGRLAVSGRDRFLRERAFLDRLVGRTSKQSTFHRPVPDPVYFDSSDDYMCVDLDRRIVASQDYYPLEDEQFDAYLNFRRQMDDEFGRPKLRDNKDR